MNDLIRRQDAIDAMYQLEAEDIETYGCSIPEGFDAKPAVEALEALSSAEPERKWIPCSERLPDWDEHRDEMVLVCYGNGSIRFDTYMHDDWVHGYPIAWMPLPEPWRGE